MINLNKPSGISSAKALYRVRAITGVRKSGHAGTLDPAATGVLILCLGRATKLVERLMGLPKVYRVAARLDATSESFDSDRPLVDVPVAQPPDRAAVEAALRSFEGAIEQVPPLISAVKVRGLPSYRRVLKGQSPELKARAVQIHWIQLRSFEWPALAFDLACGRGTYVRALIRDLGQRLGTGGVLTQLSRLRIGPFAVEDAWTIEQVAAAQAAGQVEPGAGRVEPSDAPPPWLISAVAVQALLEGPGGAPPPRPER